MAQDSSTARSPHGKCSCTALRVKSDDLIAAKVFNLTVAIADLAENCDGVLSKRRNGIKARRAIGKPQWTSDNRDPAHRRLHLPDHLPRDDLRMCQNLSNALDLSVWQAVFAKPVQPFLMSALQKNLLNEFFQRPSILPAPLGCFESGILQQVGALDYLLAENLPVFGGGYCEIHVDSVAREIRSVRRHIVMSHSNSGRFFSLMPVVVGKISEPGNRRLKHRDVDKLSAASFFSLIKSQKNSDSRIHRRREIDDRQPDFCRLVRITCGGYDAGFTLDQQIISFHIAVRPVLAVARQGTINQPGVAGAKLCRS